MIEFLDFLIIFFFRLERVIEKGQGVDRTFDLKFCSYADGVVNLNHLTSVINKLAETKWKTISIDPRVSILKNNNIPLEFSW